MLALGRTGRAVIKLTTPFAFPNGPVPQDDLDPFVAALLGAFGIERCVWGSDWPFLDVPSPPDYASAMISLPRWLRDPADRSQVLWRNPARLFGFGTQGC